MVTGLTPARSLALAFVVAAYLPGLFAYWTYHLDPKPQYSFVFLLPFAAAYLFRERAPNDGPLVPGGRFITGGLFAISVLLLGLSILFRSASLVVASLIWVVGFVLWDRGGRDLAAKTWPAWALLWLAVPLPLGLDDLLLLRLRLAASSLASRVLDALLAVPNALDGNILHLENGTLFVADACSGIRSLLSTVFTLLFGLALYPRPLLHGAALVALSLGADFALNVGRIVLLAWAHADAPGTAAFLEGDVGHGALGIVLFAVLLGVVVQFDALLSLVSHFVLSWLPRTLLRLRDPDMVGDETPGPTDYPYLTRTLGAEALSRRVSPVVVKLRSLAAWMVPRTEDGQPVTPWLRPSVATVFGLLFLVQVPGLLKGPVTQVPATAAALRGALPPKLGSFELIPLPPQEPGRGLVDAKVSAVARYVTTTGEIEVQLHAPYDHWHPYEACYSGSGWTVTYEGGGRGRAGKAREFPYLSFDFRRGSGPTHHLAYTFLDPRTGEAPVPTRPDAWSLWERLGARNRWVWDQPWVVGLTVSRVLGSDPVHERQAIAALLEELRSQVASRLEGRP